MLVGKLLSPQDAVKEIVLNIRNRYFMENIGSEQRTKDTALHVLNKKGLKCCAFIHYNDPVLFMCTNIICGVCFSD
jgi:hypothetical protein